MGCDQTDAGRDDRTFPTRWFEKLLTEKVASSRSHRYRKRPGFVPVVELNPYASNERMHFTAEPPQIRACSPGREQDRRARLVRS